MADIFGTPLDDTLTGLEENDNIYGRKGNDNLFGGLGDDQIFGGNGLDHLYGGPGADTLHGGGDSDFLYGYIDDDLLYGGDGSDDLYGGGGNDRVYGGDGNDRLYGYTGSDILVGGDGDDFITGAWIDYPGISPSQSTGQGEIDTLTGGAGRDTFHLRGGSARLGGAVAHYNGGGTSDYALITDFNPEEDIIHLTDTVGGFGQTLNYILGTSPEGLPYGTGLYIERTEPQSNELIAILQDISPDSLSITPEWFF